MRDIVVVDFEQGRLMELVVALRALRTGVTAIQATTRSAAREGCKHLTLEPLAMVVALQPTDTVVDVRELLAAGMPGRTPIVLVAPDHPPRAALVRLASEYGAAALPCDEAPVVVAATVVSMLHQRQGVA